MDKQCNVTKGQATVIAFDMWQSMLIEGNIPDCKRFRDDFFEQYGEYVEGEKAPYYLMFCAFVGALDMVEWCERGETA